MLPQQIQEMLKNNYYTWKNRKNTKWIKTSIVKAEHHKTSKLLNDSTASKFAQENGLK